MNEKESQNNHIKNLESLSKSGEAFADYLLGYCYIKGDWVAQDKDIGMYYLKSAASKNYVPAQYMLACHLDNQNKIDMIYGLEVDTTDMMSNFRKAAASGHAYAINDLGTVLSNHKPIENPELTIYQLHGYKAIKQWNKAHKLGSQVAAKNLGRTGSSLRNAISYCHQISSDFLKLNFKLDNVRDFNNAVEVYRKLMNPNQKDNDINLEKQIHDKYKVKQTKGAYDKYNIPLISDDFKKEMSRDFSVPIDHIESMIKRGYDLKNKNQSAKSLDDRKCFAIGFIHEKLDLAKKSPSQNEKNNYYKQCRDKKIEYFSYVSQPSVKKKLIKNKYKKPKRATITREDIKNLEQLVKSGDPAIEFLLANCYRFRHGMIFGKKKESYDLWMSSAKKGYAPAQFVVGQIYQRGLNTAESDEIAASWYIPAVEQSHPEATNNLAVIHFENYDLWDKDNRSIELFEKSFKLGEKLAGDNLFLVSDHIYNYSPSITECNFQDDLDSAMNTYHQKMNDLKNKKDVLSAQEPKIEKKYKADFDLIKSKITDSFRMEMAVDFDILPSDLESVIFRAYEIHDNEGCYATNFDDIKAITVCDIQDCILDAEKSENEHEKEYYLDLCRRKKEVFFKYYAAEIQKEPDTKNKAKPKYNDNSISF